MARMDDIFCSKIRTTEAFLSRTKYYAIESQAKPSQAKLKGLIMKLLGSDR
jgi:hypothetical protein